jgi:uncharacterized GH25 family protein
MRKFWVVLMICGMLPLVAHAGDRASDLKFLVIRDYNGKPIRNASVVLHPVTEGKQDKGGFQLKTDLDGRTGFEGVPYGTLRIQVLAQGFQTFGQDYQVDQPQMEITIKLKRPNGQYSVYEDKNPGTEKKEPEKQ